MFKFLRRKNKINTKEEKKAFTLIEVITVLLVVAMGIIGVMSLIVQNIQSQSLNKNTLIAYQLAQEGVELIRQVRDNNWVTNPGEWRKDLANGNYYMDYLDASPHSALLGLSSGNLSKNAQSMYVNYNAALPSSGFSRVISISDLSDGLNGILVSAQVYWSDHGRNYSYFLETHLYDWK